MYKTLHKKQGSVTVQLRFARSSVTFCAKRDNAVTDRKTEYKDNADRIAVERAFALAKQKYGLGLITSRLDETTRSSIALSVIAMNVDRIN